MSKRMVYLALVLLRYLSLSKVDALMVLLSKLVFGDLGKYGIARPKEGPFFMKIKYGKYPAIDVGTCSKIKSGEIQVNITKSSQFLHHFHTDKQSLKRCQNLP